VPLAVLPTVHNQAYLRTKAERMGHHLPELAVELATDHQSEHPEHPEHPENRGEIA
jgi:3,4-dihydroxy 2-butanone 4-phosphate synthase/GTP cyclohydrolase II